jgi:hypothetical protein
MSEYPDSFTEHDLSINNRLSDLRKYRCIVVLPAPRRPMRCCARFRRQASSTKPMKRITP